MLMIHRSPQPVQMEWHLLRRFWAAPGNKRWIFGTFFFQWGSFQMRFQHWMDMQDCKSASSTTPFFSRAKRISLIDKQAGIEDMKFLWLKKGWDQRHPKKPIRHLHIEHYLYSLTDVGTQAVSFLFFQGLSADMLQLLIALHHPQVRL